MLAFSASFRDNVSSRFVGWNFGERPRLEFNTAMLNSGQLQGIARLKSSALASYKYFILSLALGVLTQNSDFSLSVTPMRLQSGRFTLSPARQLLWQLIDLAWRHLLKLSITTTMYIFLLPDSGNEPVIVSSFSVHH